MLLGFGSLGQGSELLSLLLELLFKFGFLFLIVDCPIERIEIYLEGVGQEVGGHGFGGTLGDGT